LERTHEKHGHKNKTKKEEPLLHPHKIESRDENIEKGRKNSLKNRLKKRNRIFDGEEKRSKEKISWCGKGGEHEIK
jgi:hypothetical protein